ncbi:hypothetical protein Mlab_0569 [Methanocorpusculum labreanum Z]|uniref:Uncharacterized protein n=1 Tax=Methanocorpusculum labreanum (strain ATCC 43576 / DSM 4855 / Z) TaxID=410358 RepID=A2SQY7_METLZ|nr:hypothetical protein [Methanocorpusculum labreanum]ABN06743.1 hypothetical protein Mlab_0569 [Methanocorpusculum labreanum Z]
MNYIPLTAAAGAAFYIILMLIESALHPVVLPAALVGSLLLGALASLFVWKSDHAKHTGEMVLIWVMIFCFIIYGILRFWGVL